VFVGKADFMIYVRGYTEVTELPNVFIKHKCRRLPCPAASRYSVHEPNFCFCYINSMKYARKRAVAKFVELFYFTR
jgi:hypothetical protein